MLATALQRLRRSRLKTRLPLSSRASQQTTRLVLDDLILDDATASDNCGGDDRSVSETIAGDAARLHRCPRSLRRMMLATALQRLRRSRLRTTAPEFTSIPADYTSECSDDLILDDAASDNCGEVTIEVSSETIAGDAAGNYTVVHTFTATDDAGNSMTTQTITVEDTTAPEFTSIPADYTSECSDDLILDDATASDNCGEVTIGVSSETIAGDAAGNYTVVTFTATDDVATALQRLRRSRLRTRLPLSSRASQQTTRLSALTI